MVSFGYQWHGQQWSKTGCPGEYNAPGWYMGDVFIASDYKNPSTGVKYTIAELEGMAGGGGTAPPTTAPTTGVAPTTTPTTTPTTPAPTLTEGVGPGGLTYEEYLAQAPEGMSEAEIEAHWSAIVGAPQHIGEVRPEVGPGAVPTTPTPVPTFGAGAGAGIPTPTVTPAPAYEISPEEQAWKEEYGAKLTDWVKEGGYGIPAETQSLMIQQQTDALKAREQENIRVMKNNMERRGITNSGYIDANMHMITSNTSVAIAGAISDVQIKSALMKMASFEKAMGAAAQFLGYLSEQSQLTNQPKFLTWQAEQLATMHHWQGQLDILKLELNQAYQQQNIKLTAQLQSQLAEQTHQYDIELTEMELEAANQQAAAEGIGSIFGGILGLITG